MKPFPVLPFSEFYDPTSWPAFGTRPASSPPLPPGYPATASSPPLGLGWVVTTTAAGPVTLQPAAPGDQPEDQEADEADPEPEPNEDSNKLRSARPRPIAEGDSTAAWGTDGTINPPFP